jgi:hypothetical protein
VAREEVGTARGVLERLARTEAGADGEGDAWLAVHIEPNRAGEVNRALAEAGVYASGLESGTDLELLFLQLTGGAGPGHEGTFGSAGADPVVRGRGPEHDA